MPSENTIFNSSEKKDFISTKLPQIRRKCFDVLHAYTPGEQPQDIDQWIKLNTNENPYSPPDHVIHALEEAIKNRLRMYPDPTAKELKQKICEKYLSNYNTYRSVENVAVFNGSDETLDVLYKTFIDPGDQVLYCKPSYGMYPVLAETYDGVKVTIPLDPTTFTFTQPEYRMNDKLLIICSPNNPNGDSIPNTQLEEICDQFPGIVFVDEAYGDFAEQSALDLLNTHPNLVVGKTFSKSFGMASIRLGFVIAHEAIINLFDTIRLPYNVTYLTQVAGIAALEAWDEIAVNIGKIKSERDRMIGEMQKLGYDVLPSQSNFFLLRFESQEKAAEFYTGLKARKILVRYWSNAELGRFVRVTVGTPSQNTQFLDALPKTI